MFKFIKNCFNEVKVRINGQEVTGVKKVLAFVLSAIALVFVIGIVGILIVGSCALFVASLAIMLCVAPVVLIVEGIKQIVGAARDLHNLKKKKKNIANKYSEQLKIIEENYNENRESINNTMESLEASKSVVQDELGEEVVVQELVPIDLEDMDAYIQYVSQFNSADAHILISNLAVLKALKSKIDMTFNQEEREKLEREYSSLMFSVQDRMSKHIEQINNMNSNFDKGSKKRRLFK